jgi:biopolymer transport protein ExbB/TolQ
MLEIQSHLLSLLRLLVAYMELPVVVALFAALTATCLELGVALGERARGLARLRRDGDPVDVERLARARIERVELLARIGPMLGLMGTLVPLGPGLAALGRGDAQVLAQSMTTAFDTTSLGLFVGMVGFLLGRARRRWYEGLLDQLEARHAA